MKSGLILLRLLYPLAALFCLATARLPAEAVPAQAASASTKLSPVEALPSPPSAVFRPQAYTPAGLRLTFTPLRGDKSKGFLDLVLIPIQGDVIGKRIDVETATLRGLLSKFYSQLATQEVFNLADPQLPARQLYALLIAPIAADLQRLGITTLLISTDTTLQAIPFAALTDGQRYFGQQYAFSLTPSLRLTPLQPPDTRGRLRTLVAGASKFADMVPLPLVPQELNQLRPGNPDLYLNSAFTPSLLINAAADPSIKRVHLATHAEFLPGGPTQSKIYTGSRPITLAEFATLRQRRLGNPLDLFTISACRTALGDTQSELGFAGLALQAGARTAVGTLWYLDDVATSAFFVQFYRYLDLGLPKAEALQATRLAFATGTVHLQGDRVVGETGELLSGLTADQRARISNGMKHPYYWAGISMLGSAW
jgi:CHAT domain-containing protein